jgi:TonB family protein
MTGIFTHDGLLPSRARRSMLVLFTLVAGLIQTPVLSAQQIRINTSGRKIVQNLIPEYPRSLKEVHVGGLVRLSVTVTASGNVVRVNVVGGNPIFAENASKAVMKWKFSPAASQTEEPIQFFFNPN